MDEYFYRTSDRVIGPLSWQNIETLCERGLIGPATPVRKNDGFWTEASNIDELSPHFRILNDIAPPRKEMKSKSTPPPSKVSPPSPSESFDDLFAPKKMEEFNMAQLYSESQNRLPKSNSNRHKEEEGSSYFSVGVMILVALAAHGAIAWNYGPIAAFVRDLFGMK